MSNKNLTYGLIVVGIIAIVGLFTPAGKAVVTRLGGATNFDEVQATTIKIGGTNGSRIGPIIATSCVLTYSNSSVVASTTAAFDCPVTGVVSTDLVFVQTATTTANGAGWLITGAAASTTADWVTVRVANNSGATGNIPRNIASGTPVLIVRPVTAIPGL